MRKENYCKECNHSLGDEVICDTCGKQLSMFGNIIYKIGKDNPLHLLINNTDYDFCNFKCLKIFIDTELKKETK